MGTMQSPEFMARDSTAWNTSSVEVMGRDLLMGSFFYLRLWPGTVLWGVCCYRTLWPGTVLYSGELMLQPVLRSWRVYVAEGRDATAYLCSNLMIVVEQWQCAVAKAVSTSGNAAATGSISESVVRALA
jgi:hypothetical protein